MTPTAGEPAASEPPSDGPSPEPGPDPGSDPSDGPSDGPSDADLLRAHVEGDPDAFGLLFARHRDRLWAIALRTMGNPEDAADGLQDGLVAAFRRAASFRGEAAVTTWLHRVVVNACLDRLRAARSRRAEPLPDDLAEYERRGSLRTSTQASGQLSGQSPGSTSADTDDPLEAVVAGDRRRAVLAALQRLPAEQRAALVLVDMEGYAVSEAAAVLGCAVGTVKSRCSRGRTRLAGMLELHLGEPAHVPEGNRASAPSVASPESPRAPPEA